MSAELESAFRRSAPRPSGPPPVQEIIRRGRRQRARITMQVVAAAAVVGLAAPAAMTGARSVFGVPDISGPLGTGIADVGVVPIDGSPHSVAYGEGSAWVPTSEGTVQRIDPVSDRVTATIRVVEKSRRGGRLVGEGGEDLGPAPARPAGSFGSITTGEGAVWVTAHLPGGCRLFKIVPEKNAVSEVVKTPCYPLLVAGGSVWVGAGQDDGRPNHLIQFDPVSLEEVGRVDVGACCMSGIAYSGGYVWVGRQDVSNVATAQDSGGNAILDMELDILQIDPDAASIVREIELPGDTYHSGDTLLSNSMAASPTGVWFTRPEAQVLHQVGSDGSLRFAVPLLQLHTPDYPVAGDGWVVVSDINRSKIAVVDDSGQVLDVHDTGAAISGTPATDGEFVWVPDAEQDRILKLRVQT